MTDERDIIDHILEIEGEAYTNDPSDSGGETKWGITLKVARSFGYTGNMRELTRDQARTIYKKRYLVPIKYDRVAFVSRLVADEMADTSVNCGVQFANKSLQRSLNVLNNRQKYYDDLDVDGVFGEITFEALTTFVEIRGDEGLRVLYKMLNAIQGAFYVELCERREKDEKYVYGWFKNRV